jgi:hypothetical protein
MLRGIITETRGIPLNIGGILSIFRGIIPEIRWIPVKICGINLIP